MSRIYNKNVIKAKWAYSTQEIAELLNVHPKTVVRWVKDGLTIVPDSYPYLIMGYELIKYLSRQQNQRKCSIQQDEFFCVKCRQARKSKNGEVKVLFTGKIFADGSKEVYILGICECCGISLFRFTSDKQLKNTFHLFNITNKEAFDV